MEAREIMTPKKYKKIREKLGRTQAGLAARLGVTRKTINSRETNAVRITREAEYAVLYLQNEDAQRPYSGKIPISSANVIGDSRRADADPNQTPSPASNPPTTSDSDRKYMILSTKSLLMLAGDYTKALDIQGRDIPIIEGFSQLTSLLRKQVAAMENEIGELPAKPKNVTSINPNALK